MTAQMHDTFIYKNKEYDLVAYSQKEPYNPRFHGLGPIGTCSACWRGYTCCYYIKDNNLSLKDLNVNLYDDDNQDRFIPINGPIINGIKPIEPPNEYILFNNIYQDINFRLDYSGGFLIADEFIQELYIHLGFQPVWKYRIVYELIFEKGKFFSLNNRSVEIARFRESLGKGIFGSKYFARSKDIKKWNKKSFLQKYKKHLT